MMMLTLTCAAAVPGSTTAALTTINKAVKKGILFTIHFQD